MALVELKKLLIAEIWNIARFTPAVVMVGGSREQMLSAFNPKDVVWQHKITSRGRAGFNTARADLLS